MNLFNRHNPTEEESLPKTRREEFFYIFRNNYLLLTNASLLYFVFLLPLIYIELSTYMNYSNLLNSESRSASELFSIALNGSIISLPMFLILSIGSAGINYIISKLTLGGSAKFIDFFRGIKENWLSFLIIYSFFWLFIFLFILNYVSYFYLGINPIFKLILWILAGILLFFFLLIKPYLLFQVIIFKSGFIQTLKNAWILGTHKLYKNILATLFSNVLFVGLFFFKGTYLIINIIVIIMAEGAIQSLANFLNCINILETSLNKESLGNLYHKGLEK